MSKFVTLPALAGLAVVLSAIPLTAASARAPKGQLVHYDDLDLASADGWNTLDARLKRAVTRVCGTRERDLVRDKFRDRCMIETMSEARLQRDIAIARARPTFAVVMRTHKSN